MTDSPAEVRIGDHALVVSDKGSAGGPAFLLVHGIGMGRDAYVEFIDALSERGRILALDLPGFGDAPKPPRSLTIPQLADLVAAFLAEWRVGQVVAVGHSMGTQVVAELAVRHPQSVSNLVLIGPTVNDRERTAAWQVWRMVQDLFGEHPKVIIRGLWLYLKTGPTWFIAKFRTMMAHRIEDILPRIAVPTLVMRGRDDRVCPAEWVQRVAAAIPDAQYEEVAGKGHEAMIRSAEPVAELIVGFVRA
ncbi:MAG: alpha/beta hydrolase [Cryobacterium sp.]|nr:alpha/beta hydrolase [Cryobacterium sp.]